VAAGDLPHYPLTHERRVDNRKADPVSSPAELRAAHWKQRELSGWGRTSVATVPTARPHSVDALIERVLDRNVRSVLAYGGGRSYGDNGLNSDGAAIVTGDLNQIISFDAASGELICEAGVTYQQLIDQLLPKGYVMPVSPGTAFVTLGGAIANDVHGKNHDRLGSLGNHINWIDLVLADGSILRASPLENSDLFAATIGGLGLTGIICRLSVQLVDIGGNSVTISERRIGDLDEFIDELALARESSHYSVGWIDVLKRGPGQGRGVLETAEPAHRYLGAKLARRFRLPLDLPSFSLNRYSVGLFNSLYYRRIPTAGRQRDMRYDQFTYPLDAIQAWNRMYGKAGFYQFQCVLPDEASRAGLRQLLNLIAGAGAASFLAVLKTLGGPSCGLLSFPMRGYTLALDLPRKPGVLALMGQLEKCTLDHGGRIYLAKDATLSANGFKRMYPNFENFKAVRKRFDPRARFRSDMGKRLEL
jgi:decaprenylphospho-beta-D-ribofuranose 2-oxidase